MTVRITKPEINITEKLSELDKPSGIAGEAMLRAETPQEQFNLIGAGRKNLLVNGDFRVAQRGTTGVAPNDRYGQYPSLDRWATYRVGHRFTQVESIVNGTYKKVLEAEPSNIGMLYLYQVIENASRLISDKNVTLSFWAKADDYVQIKSGIRFANNSNTNLILDDGIVYYDLDTEWRYYTGTMRLKDTLLDSDTSRNAWLMLFHASTFEDPNKIYFADIQLELGPVATPFEHRSYGEELALCQRYYQDHTEEPVVRNIVPYSTSNSYADSIVFPVTMRTTPTVTVSDGSIFNGSWISPDESPVYRVTKNGFNWEPRKINGFVQWQPFLGSFRYTASAEL